jgi:hypothetical protein
MKTSTFLTKVLNKFHGGKSYTTSPGRRSWASNDPNSSNYFKQVTAASRGRNNLKGMVERVAKDEGVKTTKAILAICNSLGHASYEKFATSKNITFSKVEAVLKAAIKRARANAD